MDTVCFYWKAIWGKRKVTKSRRKPKTDLPLNGLQARREEKTGKGSERHTFLTIPLGFSKSSFAHFLPWSHHGFWLLGTKFWFLACCLRSGITVDRCGEVSALGSSPLHWILITVDNRHEFFLPFLLAPAGEPASGSLLMPDRMLTKSLQEFLWKLQLLLPQFKLIIA